MAEIVVKLVNGELAGKTMQQITKEVNAASLALKKAEIGTQSWVDANKKLEHAKQLQGDLKKQIEATAAASDALKAAWNKLPGAQFFNQIGESFGMMKKGVGGLVSQFGVLKTAIAATGIGALIIALVTLIDWFKKTDEGATLLGGVFRGLEEITNRLFTAVRKLGEGLVEAFKNPKQAALDFVQFIKDQFINRINSIGVAFEALGKIMSGEFKDGLKKLADAQIQFTLGITDGTDKLMKFGQEIANVVQQGIALEEEFDRIADKQRELDVQQADTEKKISQLLLQSKRVALSYEERIALLDEASALETKTHHQQLQNAKDLEAASKIEAERLAAQGKLTDEADKKQKDATIARINLEKHSIDLQEKIENRRSALVEKRDAEILKSAEEEKKLIQGIEQLKVQAMEEGMARDIAQIELDTQLKIEALTGSEEQITQQQVLLEEIKQQQIQAVKDKYAQEAAAKDEKVKKEQEDRDKKLADEQKRIAEDKARFEQQMADIERGIASDTFALAGDLAAKSTKNAEDAKKIQKGFALVDIGINLQKELSANAVAAAANPLNAVTFGAAGASQLAASNLASLVRAAIGTARVIAFRKGGFLGGLLRGPKHEAGGIPGVISSTGQPIEMEGDEFIFSGKATQAIGAKNLARVNDYYTNKFESGGPVDPFKGTTTPGDSSFDSSSKPDQSLQRLESFLIQNFQAVNARIDRIKVENVVTETEDALKTLNTIRDEADV